MVEPAANGTAAPPVYFTPSIAIPAATAPPAPSLSVKVLAGELSLIVNGKAGGALRKALSTVPALMVPVPRLSVVAAAAIGVAAAMLAVPPSATSIDAAP